MRFVSGVGGGGWSWVGLGGIVATAWLCVRVCVFTPVLCVGAYAYVHACMSQCVCALAVLLYVCVCVCFIGCWGAGVGGSHGAALCLSHLPPHSTDTQGNGGEGGEFILKEGLRVQRPNGQQCGFLLMARGKGQWRGVWKPIYQSL